MHFEDVCAIFVEYLIVVGSELVISHYRLDQPDCVVDGDADAVDEIDESVAAGPQSAMKTF